MKTRAASLSVVVVGLFLTLIPSARASTKWYVDGVNGNDSNNCMSPQTACKTIGHAISLASSGDSIMVAAATYTENPIIGIDLAVIGSDAKTTIIERGSAHTVVYVSNHSTHALLANLTIRNGATSECGGGIDNNGVLTAQNVIVLRNSGGNGGGGICNYGVLVLRQSLITENTAGGEYDCFGAGIYNLGTLTISSSTISRNQTGCTYLNGAGIYNAGLVVINNSTISGNGEPLNGQGFGSGVYNDGGTVTINNSTVSRNTAGNVGGAISTLGGTLTINNSTISGNSATGAAGGINVESGAKVTISSSTISGNSSVFSYEVGNGISNSGSRVMLQNTILANGPIGGLFSGNCSGPVASLGYNLSSDDTCRFKRTGDLNNTIPVLGPLQDNGGPTETHALLEGSPAVDAGNPNGCTDGQGQLLKTDQRGFPRPDKEDNGVGCDIGAFERQSD